LRAQLQYAEKAVELAEKNAKRWYNVTVQSMKTFQSHVTQPNNMVAFDIPDEDNTDL